MPTHRASAPCHCKTFAESLPRHQFTVKMCSHPAQIASLLSTHTSLSAEERNHGLPALQSSQTWQKGITCQQDLWGKDIFQAVAPQRFQELNQILQTPFMASSNDSWGSGWLDSMQTLLLEDRADLVLFLGCVINISKAYAHQNCLVSKLIWKVFPQGSPLPVTPLHCPASGPTPELQLEPIYPVLAC